ncbi:MAG: methyltransferase domain-containing protein [Acidobacteriota bacterium]|nr:methyltransferase domain-containing protein [Acidobacteriota bacterium]
MSDDLTVSDGDARARLVAADVALQSAAGAGRPGPLRRPSSWLIDHAQLLQPGGTVLDVACGRGRHALLLASAGCRVRAIDRNPEAIDFVRATAERLGLEVSCSVVDLETSPPPALGSARYDAVLVFNYLHRPLFPALRGALAVGGRLFYETFTIAQAERGRPTNPAFLLRPSELQTLVAPLVVLRSREGEVDGQCLASIVAERQT